MKTVSAGFKKYVISYTPPSKPSKRFVSLDFMRGLIIILLLLQSAGIYKQMYELSENNSLGMFFLQFFPHQWNGLRFWDLIQPAFMFMAGVSLAFSLNKHRNTGLPWLTSFRKIFFRCFWLLFFGVLDHAVQPHGLSFELWNVLAQMSFTTMVAFLIYRLSNKSQVAIAIGILFLTEGLYRFTNIPGFSQPFTDQHNFGNYVDLLIMHKTNSEGWTAINCIPTAVHTIAGAMTGKLLLSSRSKKIRPMIIAGIICLLAGYLLDWTHITPIIKKIATTSYTLASLGWCLLALGLFYWRIDQNEHKDHLLFCTVVGKNSLFIYLFIEIVGAQWFNGYVSTITNGLLGMVNVPQVTSIFITSIVIFFLYWGLCYFLYCKKIFFRV